MDQFSNHTAIDALSDVARIQFLIRTALSGLRTSMPARVTAVTNAGGISPVGCVTVQPLVGALDGNAQMWEHSEVANIPYLRIQGGANAVILDPQVGDIGIMTVCDRDISSVKETSAVSAPGSLRRFNFADAVYLATIISATPGQYMAFSGDGITVFSPGIITIQANQINIIGPVNQSGGMLRASDQVETPIITALNSMSVAGLDVGNHYHGDVQTGPDNTGPMVD